MSVIREVYSANDGEKEQYPVPDAPTPRQQYVVGLREVADFLEAHPDLPFEPDNVKSYCNVTPENYLTVMSTLPSPEIDDLPGHDIFYITQRFTGGTSLRYIQKKKGIFQPQIVEGEVKWHAPKVTQ